MKIAFIVEFPTQFEVPFYQYVSEMLKVEGKGLKAESLKQKAQNVWGLESPDEKKEQAAQDFDSSFDSPDIKSGQAAFQDDVAQSGIDFHVIYNNTNQEDYHDFELGKKVGWGFNLYEGYTYFIADQNDIVNSISTILEREKYDYIILNGYKNSYAGLVELCKKKHIPIALRIDAVLYNLSPLKKILKRIYLPFAYRKFNHFFAVGSETKKYLNWLGVSNERISYFSYSVDEKWFRDKSRNQEKVSALKERLQIKNERVFLSVAKFVPRESPWDILKAFKNLNDEQLVLILVGDGEERLALESYAKQNPQLKIKFVGYIPYQELPYYYGISTIFIHAAKNEPWGVSVQEALSCGCTVIASDKVGSSKDLIVEGENGYTYPFNNTEILSSKIKQSFLLDKVKKNHTNELLLNNWGYTKMWEEIKSVKISQTIHKLICLF
jgi:glycosyltransferase involved in cell wall biosynthesis